MKLAVISHTPHYIRNGKVAGWGPTVRELDHLTQIFDEVIHLAPQHPETAPESSISYTSGRVKFIPLKKYGGESVSEKLTVITSAFYNLKIIADNLRGVDWVQFRAPTAMGLYVLPYLALKKNPRRWVKYAGNWKMPNPPLSYSIQKYILERNWLNCNVTINGNWEGQKEHIISFPNPCLDNKELATAHELGTEKDFSGKLNLCFVGTLTKNKGCGLIPDAVLRSGLIESIGKLTFAGGGSMQSELEKEVLTAGLTAEFTGFLNRNELGKVYAESHIIILPSESEGFPKVIAEAAAYGCVPVVSDVSSISQFFGEDSAFLLRNISAEGVSEALKAAFADREALKQKSLICMNNSGTFTFSHYLDLLKERVLKQ